MADAVSPELPEAVPEFLDRLRRHHGRPCASCTRPVCGHDALMSLMTGFQDAPRCAPCLAALLGLVPEAMRGELRGSAALRECFSAGWRWASASGTCRCESEVSGVGLPPMTATEGGCPTHDSAWDAGDLGCGDLVLDLRMKLMDLSPGTVLCLTARDPGAPADIPSWCRMTGHTLVHSQPPNYWIRRKEK